MFKIYINVTFEHKDKIKKVGGKWDNDKKMWYAPNQQVADEVQKMKVHYGKVISFKFISVLTYHEQQDEKYRYKIKSYFKDIDIKTNTKIINCDGNDCDLGCIKQDEMYKNEMEEIINKKSDYMMEIFNHDDFESSIKKVFYEGEQYKILEGAIIYHYELFNNKLNRFIDKREKKYNKLNNKLSLITTKKCLKKKVCNDVLKIILSYLH
jgi:hypothetical protein